MAESNPLISVLIPVFNAGAFLKPSLESIICQSYTNLEIILIDDGSTDDCMASVANIKDSRIRVFEQANRGKPAALNRALDNMKGDFYAIHDADDLSHPNRIERQADCLLRNQALAGVLTGHELIIDSRRIAPRFSPKGVEECRLDIEEMRMPAHDPTVMYRFSKVDGIRFDESLPGCEGFDHLLRVGEKFPLMVLGECLYSYRIHKNSVTRRTSNRIDELLTKVELHAQVRRGVSKHMTDCKKERPRSRRRVQHVVVSHFIESVLDLKRARRFWHAVKTSLKCLALQPLDPIFYKPLLFACASVAVVNRYRRLRRAGGGR